MFAGFQLQISCLRRRPLQRHKILSWIWSKICLLQPGHADLERKKKKTSLQVALHGARPLYGEIVCFFRSRMHLWILPDRFLLEWRFESPVCPHDSITPPLEKNTSVLSLASRPCHTLNHTPTLIVQLPRIGFRIPRVFWSQEQWPVF